MISNEIGHVRRSLRLHIHHFHAHSSKLGVLKRHIVLERFVQLSLLCSLLALDAMCRQKIEAVGRSFTHLYRNQYLQQVLCIFLTEHHHVRTTACPFSSKAPLRPYWSLQEKGITSL
ncbi:MAG: hypothetical protein IPO90_07615, partial [Flavobacteriales bacterium]|nr:hypothetical protein [Flavobacteriales bacterium]